jgi:enamine deaminase RidA (YjgF/YER057c/UK114 family)
MDRRSIIQKTKLEKDIGFSRAVRIGNIIAVSGTAPISEDGTTAHPGDLYRQTLRCLDISRKAVEELGGNFENVYRTRIMLTDISQWQEAARAHGEIFRNIAPASTFVEAKGFINKDWLVEIELDCFVAKS